MIDHKYIVLLDNVVEKSGSFALGPAMDAANITESEINLVLDAFFYTEQLPDSYSLRNQDLEWKLKPEALFGYLSYKQYEQAVTSSNRAYWLAFASFLVAAVTLAVSFAGAI